MHTSRFNAMIVMTLLFLSVESIFAQTSEELDSEKDYRLVVYCTEEGKQTTRRFVVETDGDKLVFTPQKVILPEARAISTVIGADVVLGTFSGGLGIVNADGSKFKRIADLPNSQPWGMAVDQVNGQLYWSDRKRKAIYVSGLDGANQNQLIGNLGEPRGIAIDMQRGYLFWADSGETGTNTVHRANLPGGEQVRAISAKGKRPLAVAVDAEHAMVYWSDGGGIHRADFDGGHHQEVVALVSSNGIAIAGRRLFWTDYARGSIRSSGLVGEGIVDVVTGLDKPSTLHITMEPIPKREQPQPKVAKTTAPSEEETATQRGIVRQVYKLDYEQANSASRKSNLADKLFTLAKSTSDDPTARFALLLEASDMMASAGLAPQAIEIVEVISAQYENVDSVRMLSDVLATALEASPFPFRNKLIAERAILLIPEAVKEDKLELANTIVETAIAAAGKSRDKPTIDAAAAASIELRWFNDEHSRVVEAMKHLEAAPADPKANLVVGMYYCFVRDDWDMGLQLLSNTADPDVKTLALQELAEPTDPENQVIVGDGWWDLADSDKVADGPMRVRIKNRALDWYRRALPELKGFSKVRLQKRIAEAEKR